MHYDYLIVGAGLYGAVFAHEKTLQGKRCLVIDRRDHIAGNIYTERVNGIQVHRYGAHIFHTSDREVWAYFPHKPYPRMGICESLCGIQQLHQCADRAVRG